MERIVNGHYADAHSTRDIIGITPDEFETIIASLQFYHQSLELLLSATPEQRMGMYSSAIETGLHYTEQDLAEKLEEAVKGAENKNIGFYNSTYEILAAINQPYPGATY